jgi:hypothetical protein
VAADGKVYVTSEEGEKFVVRHGPGFELLSKNAVGEIVLSTPGDLEQGDLPSHPPSSGGDRRLDKLMQTLPQLDSRSSLLPLQ